MPYQLEANEGLRDGLRRITSEELDAAVARLRADGESDRVTDIHEARKHIKKARSALRLVRGELGDKAYRKQNSRLREAAGRLSAARDAQVAVATLQKLAPGEFPAVAAALSRSRDAASEQVAGDADGVRASIDDLAIAGQRASAWPLPKDNWRAVGPGLRRGYQRGARAYNGLGKKPTVEALHAWRKRVKDLWYHLRIVAPVWPGPLDELAEQAHKLSEQLGDDHDLAVLRETVTDSFADGLPRWEANDHETAALINRIDERRTSLQGDARRLGRRMYVDTPRAFERRLRSYWDAWRQETAKDAKRSVGDGEGSADEAPEHDAAHEAQTGNGQIAAPPLGSVEPLRVEQPSPAAPASVEPQLEAPALGTFEAAPPARSSVGVAEPQLDPPEIGTFEIGAGQSPPPPASGRVEADTVYATRTGARFHRRTCSLLPGAPRALERDEAVTEGLRPCRTCRP